jgi:hypothetical protein
MKLVFYQYLLWCNEPSEMFFVENDLGNDNVIWQILSIYLNRVI